MEAATQKVKTQTAQLHTFTPFLTAMSGIIAVALVILFLVSPTSTPYLQFHLNIYAILSFIAAFADLLLIILINRPKHRAPESFWFSVFVGEVMLWGFMEGLQRLSTTPKGAVFWHSLSAFAWVPLGVTLYIYTLIMTRHTSKLRNLRGMLAIVGLPALVLTLTLRTPYIINFAPSHAVLSPWGYYSPYGSGFVVFLLWLEMFLVASVIIMFQYYRQSTDVPNRRRALFNIVGILVPLVGGTLCDGILPMLHYHVLPVAVLLTTVTTLVIGYAILRYKIFTANPALVANNIIEGMSEAVLILDSNFRVTFANPSSVRLFGHNQTVLQERELNQLLEADGYTNIKEELEHPLPGTTLVREHCNVVGRGGELVPAVVSIDRLAISDSQTPGYVMVATDLSAVVKIAAENRQLEETKFAMLNALEDAQQLEEDLQKEKASVEHKVVERTEQLSREQARLRASINSLEVGFIITDEQNELLSANTAARDILAAPHAKTLNALLAQAKPDIDIEARIASCLQSLKPIVVSEALLKNRYVQVVITPVLLNAHKAIGTVVLIEDITEEKALQRSRDEFFSIASHELRTPLTAIRGNTSLIQTYFTDALKGQADLRELIDDIHTSSVRLIDIVNDFLNVSRLEQGNVEFSIQPTPLKPIVESVANEMATITREKGVAIVNNLTDEHIAMADQDRIKQVVYNFVGNALKFTESGSITLSAKVEGKKLKVFVTDTGSGIPADRQHLLFHKFQQASDNILTRDTTRGTGLGLYISKLLVERMDGKIRLESSEVGKGSVFSFTLPLAVAAKR